MEWSVNAHKHRWVPVGMKQIDHTDYSKYRGTSSLGSMPLVMPDIRDHVVRACSECDAVRLVELDINEALKQTA